MTDTIYDPTIDPADADRPDEASDDGYRTFFDTAAAWVTGWLLPTVRRRAHGETRWCPRWWDHSEAEARLNALWWAWEAAAFEGGGSMSIWWNNHFDPTWAQLTSSAGPFGSCSEDRHTPDPAPLATIPEEDR